MHLISVRFYELGDIKVVPRGGGRGQNRVVPRGLGSVAHRYQRRREGKGRVVLRGGGHNRGVPKGGRSASF